MEQSINQLVIIPKTIHYGVFYLNGNFKDAHTKKYEDLYLFIASMLKPPAITIVHKAIYTHEPFFVDVKNNYVEILTFESANKIQKMRENNLQKMQKQVLKLLREKKKKEKKQNSFPYEKEMQSVLAMTLPKFTQQSQSHTKIEKELKKKKQQPKIYSGWNELT